MTKHLSAHLIAVIVVMMSSSSRRIVIQEWSVISFVPTGRFDSQIIHFPHQRIVSRIVIMHTLYNLSVAFPFFCYQMLFNV